MSIPTVGALSCPTDILNACRQKPCKWGCRYLISSAVYTMPAIRQVMVSLMTINGQTHGFLPSFGVYGIHNTALSQAMPVFTTGVPGRLLLMVVMAITTIWFMAAQILAIP